MELQFQKQQVHCLNRAVNQVQNLEQTQQLRIPEGMPGAERVVLCRGQILIRSKQWSMDSIRVAGGVQVWLMYVPEDGGSLQQLETWVPFQMDWDLPTDCPDGVIRILPRLRCCDARLVSAGKLLIRVGLAILAQGWIEQQEDVFSPGEVSTDVELKRERFPVRLPKEAGEKSFDMEETLTLPPSAPKPEKIVWFGMAPEVTEQRVLSGKLVFRGNGNLHVLYRCQDGGLHSWDFPLPFSQFAQLDDSFTGDAQADVMMAVTALELEPEEEGNLRLRASLTGQYLVDDRQTLELVSDLWCPLRETELHRKELSLPVQLDSRRENLYGEQTIPLEADTVPDVQYLPDFPRQRREGDTVTLEQPGLVQMLYYDREGQLRSLDQRMEATISMKADEAAELTAMPLTPSVTVTEGADTLTVQTQTPAMLTFSAGQGMPMVVGAELGELREPDPNRPSLILRRTGRESLWDIARESGSTVAAIRAANALEGEPEQDRMLLIPVV